MRPETSDPGESRSCAFARQEQSLASRRTGPRLRAMQGRMKSGALAGLILASLASPVLAQPNPPRERNADGRPVQTYGGAAQHYGDPRRAHRRTAAVTVPPSFFYGSGGVGAQPGYAQTYVFYGVAYPRAHAATGAFASAHAVSQVQVLVDGH